MVETQAELVTETAVCGNPACAGGWVSKGGRKVVCTSCDGTGKVLGPYKARIVYYLGVNTVNELIFHNSLYESNVGDMLGAGSGALL